MGEWERRVVWKVTVSVDDSRNSREACDKHNRDYVCTQSHALLHASGHLPPSRLLSVLSACVWCREVRYHRQIYWGDLCKCGSTGVACLQVACGLQQRWTDTFSARKSPCLPVSSFPLACSARTAAARWRMLQAAFVILAANSGGFWAGCAAVGWCCAFADQRQESQTRWPSP